MNAPFGDAPEHADNSELKELSGDAMESTNYLKANGLQLYLLLDFGKPRLAIKRVAHGL